MRAGILVVACAALLSACAPRFAQPEIRLEGARLSSIGLSGGVVELELSVYNPNRFALRASGLTYDVDLEAPSGDGWINFTEGRLDRRLEVRSGETAIIEVPVEFDYRGLGQALQRLLERGTFDYRVSGDVALEDPVRRTFGYSHSGAVTPSGVR